MRSGASLPRLLITLTAPKPAASSWALVARTWAEAQAATVFGSTVCRRPSSQSASRMRQAGGWAGAMGVEGHRWRQVRIPGEGWVGGQTHVELLHYMNCLLQPWAGGQAGSCHQTIYPPEGA